ncbi:hypothetical protein [Brevibacillus parabrevis]|uniref:hypothetical protein n=1 Tax=Brevibacillus parabrevis TaxID=54914 RepID=UPI002E247524|nr:hypothetical protein [Brevibacillus parabrevis]
MFLAAVPLVSSSWMLVTVFSRELAVEIKGETHTLRAGDSLRFRQTGRTAIATRERSWSV